MGGDDHGLNGEFARRSRFVDIIGDAGAINAGRRHRLVGIRVSCQVLLGSPRCALRGPTIAMLCDADRYLRSSDSTAI
jgi:hypothetical protein